MLDNQRIVTGLDGDGRSVILLSGPAPAQDSSSGNTVAALWRTSATPATNEGAADAAATLFDFELKGGGTRFLLAEYPGSAGLSEAEQAQRADAGLPQAMRERAGSAQPGMHATDTLDYVVLLRGEITLMVETGEVTLRPGDVVVDRGVAHAWINRGEAPALLASVMIDAVPLDRG